MTGHKLVVIFFFSIFFSGSASVGVPYGGLEDAGAVMRGLGLLELDGSQPSFLADEGAAEFDDPHPLCVALKVAAPEDGLDP